MKMLLSFNDMFKWKGPLDIKWDNPLGTLTILGPLYVY
jgi:hypothetical protein